MITRHVLFVALLTGLLSSQALSDSGQWAEGEPTQLPSFLNGYCVRQYTCGPATSVMHSAGSPMITTPFKIVLGVCGIGERGALKGCGCVTAEPSVPCEWSIFGTGSGDSGHGDGIGTGEGSGSDGLSGDGSIGEKAGSVGETTTEGSQGNGETATGVIDAGPGVIGGIEQQPPPFDPLPEGIFPEPVQVPLNPPDQTPDPPDETPEPSPVPVDMGPLTESEEIPTEPPSWGDGWNPSSFGGCYCLYEQDCPCSTDPFDDAVE